MSKDYVKLNKIPKVRVIRRIVDQTEIRYMPQGNYRNGWGWYYILQKSNIGEILRHGLPMAQESIDELFAKHEDKYEYRYDWGMLFPDLNDAIKFADDLYALWETAYPGYKRYVDEKNAVIEALDKDGKEMYRKPPKWQWLKNIFS